ncbi:MAG TPA: glutaredoxin family protein [Thermoanaerobaculia bacterium]|nr:glutaredoxin family protein [Thermoanaerobaculia bacterium]
MGRARESRHEHAQRRLRPRRAARGGSDDDARPLPVARVAFYYAPECHLCERARAVLLQARDEEEFELEEVDISGDPELEGRYREWLPVVEIDGERAFSYFVPQDALRRKLAQARR